MSKLKEIILEADAFLRAQTGQARTKAGHGKLAGSPSSASGARAAKEQSQQTEDTHYDALAREIIGQVFANVSKSVKPDALAEKLLEAAITACDDTDDPISLSYQIVTFFEQVSISAQQIHQSFVLAENCMADDDDMDMDDDEELEEEPEDAVDGVQVTTRKTAESIRRSLPRG